MQICMFFGLREKENEGFGPEKREAWIKLENALRNAWDQTTEGATKLAAVIDAVAAIREKSQPT